MTNRSEHDGDRLAAWVHSPRGGALLAALLTLAVLLPLWLLAVDWYRTELLRVGPTQQALLVFEAGGLIGMALFAGLVYLSVNRQASLSQAVQQRTQEMTRSNQRLAEDLARRQQMEEELRRSDERYRALARSFPNGAVFLFDANLRYTLADGAGLTDVGLSKEMLEGLTIWEALPPDTIEIIEPHYRAALAGEPHVFEAEFGGHVYLSRTLPLRDDRGAILAGMAVTQDITEAKRAESEREAALSALRVSESRSQALLNAIPDLMFRLDRQGTFLDYHADEGDMVLPPQSVVGGNLRQLPAPDGVVDRMLEKIAAALDTQQTQTMEYSLHTAGGLKDFEARMVADGPQEVVAIVRDISDRKQAEQSLHRWAHMFEHAEWGVTIGSADGRTLEMMNPAYAKMHGFTVEELSGLPIATVFAPGTADELSALIRAANETGHAVIESKHVRRDGSVFPVLVDLTAVKDANGQVLYRVANVQDITERKRNEETLREREEQYRSIFEASLDGLFINSLDGYVVDVNPAGARMHGYTVEECRQLRSEQLVHPEQLAGLREFIETTRAGQQFRGQGADMRKDGSFFPIEIVGTQFIYRGEPHALAIVRDITERVNVEQTLHERELQYRNIFESSLDGLAINNLNGQLVDFNPAMAHMHGYTIDEFRQIQPGQFIHPDSQPLFADYMDTVKTGREYRCRAVDVRKDGSQFYVEVVGTPFTLRGQPHAFAIVRDINAQVEAEQLLEQRVTERTRELSTLLDISRNVASTLELDPLLKLILDGLKVFVDFASARINTVEGSVLRVRAVHGSASQERMVGMEYPLSSPIVQEVVQHGHTLIIPDVYAPDDPWAATFRHEVRAYLDTTLAHARSWLSVPLIVKGRAIGNLALDHIQPGFYTSHHAELTLALANQVAVAIENARLFAEAQGKAILEERQRLARDLHDSVTQSLYSLTLLAEASRRLIDQDVPQAARYLGDIGEIAQQSLKEMRLLVYQLRPLALEREGLIGALQARLDSVEKRAGIEARLLIEGNLGGLPPALEEALFRIAQEALNNALKHAAARSVVVRLRGEDECVTLEVADDGRGSALLNTDVKGGLGLTSMKERVAQMQGTLAIDSAPSAGTRISVEVPRPLPTPT